jgi:hypothetical protein
VSLSVRIAPWRSLWLFDRPPDPRPHQPSCVIAAVKHQILKAGSFKLRVGAVLADQQVRGAPNVEVGNRAVPIL